MVSFPADIFTEPECDPDALANLGPLRPLAGVWDLAPTPTSMARGA